MKSGKDKYLERVRRLDRKKGYVPDPKLARPRKTSELAEPKLYVQVPKVLGRDNYTCQWCGKTDVYVEVHHIDGNKGNNNMDNLITVCRSCHRSHHGKKETKEKIATDRWRRNYYRLRKEGKI